MRSLPNLKLRKLKPGDKIGILAPSSPARKELIQKGGAFLNSLGFDLEIPLDPAANYGRNDGSFSAGSVQDRLTAFYSLLENDAVAAILLARGAYGAVELLPHLDFIRVGQAKKAIIGYSDCTLLLSTVAEFSGIPTIHGGTLSKEFAEATSDPDAKESALSALDLIQSPDGLPVLKGTAIRPGLATGKLLVGNLTVLTTLLGTPWELDFSDRILVIEEVGEAPYRIHRMLMQLCLAGKLQKLRALCFGRLYKCESQTPPALEKVLERFISEMLSNLKYPILSGLPVGHGGKNCALPLGVKAQVDGDELTVVESPVG